MYAKDLKVGIVGATGYTGAELTRILDSHPAVDIEVVTSESRAGEPFSDVYSHLKSLADQKLEKMENLNNYDLDLVFLALPHRVSMTFVKKFGYDKFKIIDLSGDFRLDSAEVYEKWYQKQHEFKQGIEAAAYGLPELFRDQIKDADLVANPGCYPTSAILALAPLLKNKLIDERNIVVDSKSGITGAGAKAKEVTHFPSVHENFKAYGVKTHRHTPEIETSLTNFSGNDVQVIFTPHLLPINRGIITTTYSIPKEKIDEEDLKKIYGDQYKDEPFIRLVDQPPEAANVRGSNFCDIYTTYDERTNKVIVISAIDNLVKGAAGQAVQNMNILFGLDEHLGLMMVPLNP